MNFTRDDVDIYVPDGTPMPEALARTTHLCIGAHQDDQEFMAYHGIAACYEDPAQWFTGVCVTNGSGSARSGRYAAYTDEAMMRVRRDEQRRAAALGKYACEIQLRHPSQDVKDPLGGNVTADLRRILEAARPTVVYLHNPADKHDTHVACTLRAIDALRALAPEHRPRRVYGCEIWRSLDWLCDEDKQVLDVSRLPELAGELAAVFDSQIAGGKRYDHAIAGRRMANATFFESHATDAAQALTWAMDLTPLVADPGIAVTDYVLDFIDRLREDVLRRVRKMEKE